MSETTEKYLSPSKQRLLQVLIRLGGNEISGLAPKDLVQALGISASGVTRELANLKFAGLVEQIPETGRWRLGPKIVQIAVSHSQALDRAQGRLNETKQRYSRELK